MSSVDAPGDSYHDYAFPQPDDYTSTGSDLPGVQLIPRQATSAATVTRSSATWPLQYSNGNVYIHGRGHQASGQQYNSQYNDGDVSNILLYPEHMSQGTFDAPFQYDFDSIMTQPPITAHEPMQNTDTTDVIHSASDMQPRQGSTLRRPEGMDVTQNLPPSDQILRTDMQQHDPRDKPVDSTAAENAYLGMLERKDTSRSKSLDHTVIMVCCLWIGKYPGRKPDVRTIQALSLGFNASKRALRQWFQEQVHNGQSRKSRNTTNGAIDIQSLCRWWTVKNEENVPDNFALAALERAFHNPQETLRRVFSRQAEKAEKDSTYGTMATSSDEDGPTSIGLPANHVFEEIPYQNPRPGRDSRNLKRFFCTFGCAARTFKEKGSWKRHEELHCPQWAWFCPSQACRESKRYNRREHLSSHLQNCHANAVITDADIIRCRRSINSRFDRRCNVIPCSARFTTWSERIDHVAEHFREGRDETQWRNSNNDPESDSEATAHDDHESQESDGGEDFNDTQPEGGDEYDDSGSGTGAPGPAYSRGSKPTTFSANPVSTDLNACALSGHLETAKSPTPLLQNPVTKTSPSSNALSNRCGPFSRSTPTTHSRSHKEQPQERFDDVHAAFTRGANSLLSPPNVLSKDAPVDFVQDGDTHASGSGTHEERDSSSEDADFGHCGSQFLQLDRMPGRQEDSIVVPDTDFAPTKAQLLQLLHFGSYKINDSLRTSASAPRSPPKNQARGALVKLERPFYFLGCRQKYHIDQRSQWLKHSVSHLTLNQPSSSPVFPNKVRCMLCSTPFSGSVPSYSWMRMLCHLSDHCLEGFAISSVPPDHRLVSFLHDQGLVTEKTWRKLLQALIRGSSEIHNPQKLLNRTFKDIRVRRRKGPNRESWQTHLEGGQDSSKRKRQNSYRCAEQQRLTLNAPNEELEATDLFEALKSANHHYPPGHMDWKRCDMIPSRQWAGGNKDATPSLDTSLEDTLSA